MKRLSLQWRITLMTAALIGVTCVLMNCLIGYSGKRYMDAIGSGISAYGEIESGAPDAFDPQSKQPDDELTIIISGAQAAFGVTNRYITAAVTLIGGVLAYFVSGRALRPLRSFAAQVENIQPSNLAQCKVSEEVLPEFYEKEAAAGRKAYADVIVVDPPRKGCDEKLLDTIVKMAPDRVVYVSCDSATLARDLKILCEQGYELKRVRAVEQFCHTVHTEAVCCLHRVNM